MLRLGKWLARAMLALVALGAAAWALGPYEPVDVDAAFDEAQLAQGVEAYFAAAEARFDDITEGVEKRVIWAGERGRATPLAVLYVHGFSATSEELRPVPDRIAAALGANLVFTRLRGHGRRGEAMAEATVHDWMADMAEALAAARAVGREVIVISTSTGGTLTAEALLQPGLARKVKAAVFVSPNFGINDPLAPLLTMPAARYLLPLVAGRERRWSAASPRQEAYWTTRYPTVALFPMAALVSHAVKQDYRQVDIPALFHFSMRDKVVRPEISAEVAARWGKAGADVVLVPETADAGPDAHVIAGDIVAPGNTDAVVEVIVNWLKGL